MLCVLAGLPEPEVNIVFRDAEGLVLRRADMGYRRARVSIEYDGRQHAEDDDQWAGDITRREEFDGGAGAWWSSPRPGCGASPSGRSSASRPCCALAARTWPITSSEWRRYFGRAHERSA